jgi:hypothetical protein
LVTDGQLYATTVRAKYVPSVVLTVIVTRSPDWRLCSTGLVNDTPYPAFEFGAMIVSLRLKVTEPTNPLSFPAPVTVALERVMLACP